jgi:hypothetical protein
VATRALSAYHADISDIRRAEALHAMANKEEQFAQAEKRIADDREKAAKALSEYAATVSTTEERPYLEAIQAAEQHYFAAQPELLKVSRASDGVNDALRDAYNGTTAKSLNELLTAVEKDIEFQKVGADQSYQISQDEYLNLQMQQQRHLGLWRPRNAWRPLALIETRIEKLLQIAWSQRIR